MGAHEYRTKAVLVTLSESTDSPAVFTLEEDRVSIEQDQLVSADRFVCVGFDSKELIATTTSDSDSKSRRS